DGEGRVHAAFQPLGNLFHLRAAARHGNHGGKFVAAQPGQHVGGAQLVLHAQRHFLQIEVADVVPVAVIHQLELVQVDVDQPEDAGLFTGLLNEGFKLLVQGEAV